MTTMLTLTGYADKIGKSKRTVLRYLDAGAVPGAVKVGREWTIPVDAPAPDGVVSRAVAHVTPAAVEVAAPAVRELPAVLPPGLWPLEDVAAFYGTTVRRIKAMAQHPRSPFVVGRYAPDGRSLRVWVL